MQCAIVFIQIRHSMMSHNKPIIGNCIDTILAVTQGPMPLWSVMLNPSYSTAPLCGSVAAFTFTPLLLPNNIMHLKHQLYTRVNRN